jgi:CubicO group peptidase (beta-lactamase class C family)
MSSAVGPAGLINSTVRDVLGFARLFLDHRVPEVLVEPQIEMPNPHLATHWGLGIMLWHWDGHRLCGHDGGTLGQSAFLRILPQANLAVCLLTNSSALGYGGHGMDVYHAVFSELLADLADVSMPDPPVPPDTAPDIDLDIYEGTYERLSVAYDLHAGDGVLTGTITVSGPLASLLPNPVTNVTLTPVDATTFQLEEEGSDPITAVFYEFDGGVPRYLHTGARANRRVG